MIISNFIYLNLKNEYEKSYFDKIKSKLIIEIHKFKSIEKYKEYKIKDNVAQIPRGCIDLNKFKGEIKDCRKWNEKEEFEIKDNLILRDEFQKEAFNQLINDKIDNVFMKTGSGKTILGIKLICNLGRKVCIVVPSDLIGKQWVERFKEFASHLKVSFKEIIDCDAQIILPQKLINMKYKDYSSFFDLFSIVIFDEVHLMGGKEFVKNISKFKAKRRIGLSASESRNDLSIVHKLHIGLRQLFSKYEVPKLNAYFIDLKLNNLISGNYNSFLGSLINNDDYNNIIIEQVLISLRTGRKIFLLSHRIKHLYSLLEKFENKEEIIICHSEIQDKVDFSKAKVILGTFQLFKQGIDLPEFDTIIFGTPFANKVDLEQSIGRILRIFEDKKPIGIFFRVINNFKSLQWSEDLIFWLKYLGHECHYNKINRDKEELILI